MHPATVLAAVALILHFGQLARAQTVSSPFGNPGFSTSIDVNNVIVNIYFTNGVACVEVLGLSVATP